MALAAAPLLVPHLAALPAGAAGTAVLALDLGTCTGWALQERSGHICSGSQPFRPQRYEGGGMRFLRFQRWLTELSHLPSSPGQLLIDQVLFGAS